MIKFFFVFLLVGLVNFLWARYITHIADARAAKAALYGTTISLLGNLVTIIYISDHRVIIPAAFGTFIGTYLSVRMSKNVSKSQ